MDESFFQYLDKTQRNLVINEIWRQVYPLYCCEKPSDGNHQFNGSGFFLEAHDRCFFLFCEHQFQRAKNLNKPFLWVPFEPGATVITLDPNQIIADQDLDLTAIELPPNDAAIAKVIRIDYGCFDDVPHHRSEEDIALVGYQLVRNDIVGDEIRPKVGGILSKKLSVDTPKLSLDITEVEFLEALNIKNIDDLTQGISGGPVIRFTEDQTKKVVPASMKLIGMTNSLAFGVVRITPDHEISMFMETNFGISKPPPSNWKPFYYPF